MSDTDWVLFAGCGTGCIAFLAGVVWSVGEAARWMKRKDGE